MSKGVTPAKSFTVIVCAATAGHVASQRRRHMLETIGRSVSAARLPEESAHRPKRNKIIHRHLADFMAGCR